MYTLQTLRNNEMKNIMIIFLGVASTIVIAFNLFSEEQRWLFFHGKAAEEYACALIEQNMSYKQPSRFIDYTVSSQGGYVVFSEHSDSNILYGYFPDNVTSIDGEKIQWKHLSGSWYVAHL